MRVRSIRALLYTKMATLANPSKRWHIVLRCAYCGPLGLLLSLILIANTTNNKNVTFHEVWTIISSLIQKYR